MVSLEIFFIVVILLVLLVLFFKFKHNGKMLKFLGVVIVIGLLYFSIMGVLRSNEVRLDSPRNFFSAVYLYFSWLGRTAADLWDIGTETFRMTGNVVRGGFNETRR